MELDRTCFLFHGFMTTSTWAVLKTRNFLPCILIGHWEFQEWIIMIPHILDCIPICSMYGIFTNTCPKNHPNVGNTIHGAYGIYIYIHIAYIYIYIWHIYIYIYACIPYVNQPEGFLNSADMAGSYKWPRATYGSVLNASLGATNLSYTNKLCLFCAALAWDHHVAMACHGMPWLHN